MKEKIRSLISNPAISPLIKGKMKTKNAKTLKCLVEGLDYYRRLLLVTYLNENQICLKSEGISDPPLSLKIRKDRKLYHYLLRKHNLPTVNMLS